MTHSALKENKVVLTSLRAACLFHKHAGETFLMSRLSPQGICAHAFHAGYPYYLSLMYDGLKDRARSGVAFRCKGCDCSAVWLVRALPNGFTPLLKLVACLLRILGRGFDVPDRVLEFKLLSLTGECPFGHRLGAEFRSDLFHLFFRKDAFCPQSFYTLYPFLTSDGAAIHTPWDGIEPGAVSCPAYLQQATYSVQSRGNIE